MRIAGLGVACLVGVVLGFIIARSGAGADGGNDLRSGGTNSRVERLSAIIPGSSGSGKASPLEKSIQLERYLLGLDPAEFPAILENELREALNSDKAGRIVRVWMERDFDGFVLWMRGRPGRVTLKEAGHRLGWERMIIGRAAQEDPEQGWDVASVLPGVRGEHYANLLFGLAEKEPERALALAQAHRDELSVADIGSWGSTLFDPANSVAILNELGPGDFRDAILRSGTSYYALAPERMGESEAWFQQLSPGLQKRSLAGLERFLERPKPGMAEMYESWEAIHASARED